MTSQLSKRRTIRSVLVAIDDASAGPETMEAAVNLAVDLEAELQGLYLEDVSLLRMAELPFVNEIATGSGAVRQIDAESMRKAMQQKADQLRQAMFHRAESAQIHCTFTVASGRVLQRVLLATSETDVVFFGCRSHAPSVRPPTSLRPRGAIRPVLVMIDTSPHSRRAWEIAEAVAQKHLRPLVILLLAFDRVTLRQLTRDAMERSQATRLQVTLLPQPITNLPSLIQTVRKQRPELVLLSRECPLLDDEAIESLVDQLDCFTVLA